MSSPKISKDIQERMFGGGNGDSFGDGSFPNADTPSDYIPGLYTLGSTYDVLNGRYADSKSTLQQVIDWDKTESRTQHYGGKMYSIPKVVNFVSNNTSDYRSYHGKTVSDYTGSLSVHAGFEVKYPGFSASASADYKETQRESLSNTFTRIMHVVTQYDLSLPPLSQLRGLLKAWFVDDLDNMNPIELYKQYGTHLLTSLVIGGQASFLTTTDIRTYSSDMSIEAAAHISAKYLVASGKIDLSTSQREAMDRFNESSETHVVTRGGDPRYGNEQFLSHSSEWAASVMEYPEFVDFGSSPCFVGIWELASSRERQNELKEAHTQYVTDYKTNLEVSGPYLRTRLTTDVTQTSAGLLALYHYEAALRFPRNRSGIWYFVSPGATVIHPFPERRVESFPAIIASELVPGALAPVKWERACDALIYGSISARFWRAIPPNPDYIALGAVGVSGKASAGLVQPPEELVTRFRAIHKNVLTTAERGVQDVYTCDFNASCTIFSVDGRYWYADAAMLHKLDCMRLDSKKVIVEDFKLFTNL